MEISVSRMQHIAFAAVACFIFMAAPAIAAGTDYGGSCKGTSECGGNLSCHGNTLVSSGKCTCPGPGDGAYNATGYKVDCWGYGVPSSKCYKNGMSWEDARGRCKTR